MSDLLSGLVIGFLGSAHCVGMCGPLALALPAGERGGLQFLAGRLAYNLGRIATYSLIGAAMGVLGRGIALAGFQQAASIVAGVLLLASVLLPGTMGRVLDRLPGIATLEGHLRRGLGRLLRQPTGAGLFGIGLLNGFLPCGFVYVGLAAALTTGSVAGGALVMAGFGAGTLPVMFALSVIGRRIGQELRVRITRLVPVLAVCIGLLFILRGMNLGIPYLSPKTEAMTVEEPARCH